MEDEELERKAILDVSLRAKNDDAYRVGIESYKAGYRAAQPKWLSPKDHPPADGTWAVIHMRDGSKSQGTTAIDFAKNGDWEDWMYEVTFYLPLPKLPKEEE